MVFETEMQTGGALTMGGRKGGPSGPDPPTPAATGRGCLGSEELDAALHVLVAANNGRDDEVAFADDRARHDGGLL